MLAGACANWESLTKQLNDLMICAISGRIPGLPTGLLEAVSRAVSEAVLVYEDMFLGNDHVLNVADRLGKTFLGGLCSRTIRLFRVCKLAQNDGSGYDIGQKYRFGMDMGVRMYVSVGMISSRHVDKQIG